MQLPLFFGSLQLTYSKRLQEHVIKQLRLCYNCFRFPATWDKTLILRWNMMFSPIILDMVD